MVPSSEILLLTFAHPRRAMGLARYARGGALAAMVVVGSGISMSTAAMMALSGRLSPGMGAMGVAMVLLGGAVLFVADWWAVVMGAHFGAGLMGRQGRLRDTFIAIGLAYAPLLLSCPLALLLTMLGLGGIVMTWLIVFPVLVVWSFVLAVMGVRQTYGLSSGAALMSIIVPWLVWGLALCGGLVLVEFGFVFFILSGVFAS